ncbi:MAG: CHAT domain-containing protein, partial [Bacteroidia bacterium]|nr:CHAT domain-containing protein [Bacteroidia bacterium]
LGAIFSAEGKYTEAKLALDTAIKAGLLASPEPFSRELSGWYLQRAGIKGRLGELESALRDCQLSLQKILPGYQSSGPLALGDARYYSPENRLWETFTLQGNLLYQWFEKANREDYLFAALRAHEAAMEVEALQLRALAYDESSLNLLASNRQQKNEAVAIAWRLWQLQPSPERYFKVLSIAERSRSLMLQDRKRQLDLMAGRQADPVLVSSLDEVDSLMAVAQVALRDLDPASIGYLQQEVMIDSLVSRKQQLKASLSLASPLYASARFGDLTFSLKDLQLGLPEGVLVASYFLGEGEMFLFGISHDHTDLLRIPLEKDLLAQINELYASVTSPYMGQPSSLGKYDDIRRRLSLHLYEQVLQPLTSQPAFSGLSRLWIIPDGIIGRVPFALLHTAPFSGKYYAEEPFLVKSMALGMANNLTLLFLQMNGTVSAEEAELLCVAPSYQSMGGGGSRAVGTELALPVPQGVRLVFHLQEANYLHRRYGGGFLFESKATVPQFLDEVEHYSLLHFSGHAQPDSATGLWNFLALEAEAGSYDAFAPFWQPQILALRMQAQMVFLSACETSRGKFYQGEGHSSLARAFLYGGASSVVATLWQIDDSVSLRFAERFYLNLEQGLSKDVTMQQTMLSMIAENRPPYAWAPYLLWGDAREISLSPQQPLWPYVLVIAVLLALLGGIYLRVRIRKREL